jgi:hypothetical protein
MYLNMSRELPIQADFKPTTKGKAIDRSNNGFLSHPPAYAAESGRRVPCCWFRRWLYFELGLLDQILARAEGFGASTGDDGDAETGLLVKPVEEGVGFPMGIRWDGIHGIWAIDGNQEDILSRVAQDEGAWWRGLFGELVRHGDSDSFSKDKGLKFSQTAFPVYI